MYTSTLNMYNISTLDLLNEFITTTKSQKKKKKKKNKKKT